MNYTTLIIIAIVGITLGVYFTRRRNGGLLVGQAKKKAENKEKILEFMRENKRVANNDIEKLLGVSDATATRYLDELEKEGKITQHGKIGHAVFYTLN